jgi:phosphoribosylformylglycinamidine (FGAM) synthase PurS component
MRGTYLIEVAYKDEMAEPAGASLNAEVRHLGLGKTKKVRASQLYRLDGEMSLAEKNRIADDLLTDPVTQDFKDGDWKQKGKQATKKAGTTTVVDVWYKQGVTDAAGESVSKGIRDLEIESVASVRTGMRYRFWGLHNNAQAEKITLTLLANPLVQDYVIHDDE